jgi:hypothetical protein
MAQPPRELFEFLKDAELEQYYNAFKTDLKVTTVQQIKYVEDEDLHDLGMTKPEMRRLKKFYKKECPHGTFSKIKKVRNLLIFKEQFVTFKEQLDRDINVTLSATFSRD